MRALAREIDVDEKRLYSIMYGYTRDQRKKKGRPLKGTRLAPVDYIDISTVDRWLQALGYPASKLDELYPIDTSVD